MGIPLRSSGLGGVMDTDPSLDPFGALAISGEDVSDWWSDVFGEGSADAPPIVIGDTLPDPNLAAKADGSAYGYNDGLGGFPYGASSENAKPADPMLRQAWELGYGEGYALGQIDRAKAGGSPLPSGTVLGGGIPAKSEGMSSTTKFAIGAGLGLAAFAGYQLYKRRKRGA